MDESCSNYYINNVSTREVERMDLKKTLQRYNFLPNPTTHIIFFNHRDNKRPLGIHRHYFKNLTINLIKYDKKV